MNRIGIVAALPSEIQPLTREWTRRGGTFQGRIGSIEAVAASAGMGEAAVTRACELVLAAGSGGAPIDALASVGYAGSTSCGLRSPEAVAVREVIDARTGERFSTEQVDGQRLVTLDHVASPEEKRRVAETYQAVLVDMEAAAVARVARARGLSFLCFKAVTDGPNDVLTDFNRFLGRDGRLQMTGLILHAIGHPKYWGPLRQLGQNSRAAALELANFVSRSLSGSVI
jgi:adenosylhomocysteine nucleosidase